MFAKITKNVLLCFVSVSTWRAWGVWGAPQPEKQESYDFPLVPRSEWSTMPPIDNPTLLDTPVPYVVIHHTYIPGACADREVCERFMRSMQNSHVALGWGDIGYNFCVGSDGVAYEGRGWRVRGVHAGRGNGFSLGICLIGDWTTELPPAQQLNTAKAIVAKAVELGVLNKDYKLVGHRQMTDSECPGDALFTEITTWNNYSPVPAGPDDSL